MLFTRRLIFITKIVILLCGVMYCIAAISEFATARSLLSDLAIKPYIMMLVKELAYGISFVGTAVMIELLERLAYLLRPKD